MAIIKDSLVDLSVLSKSPNGIPMILIGDSPRILRISRECNYHIINLNLELSKILIQFNCDERKNKIEQCMKKLVKEGNYLLDGIDVVFDPKFKVDVISMFCELSKSCNLLIKWPGNYDEEYLEYSQAGYLDHIKYQQSRYSLLIIKGR